jgi:hypothetical protein
MKSLLLLFKKHNDDMREMIGKGVAKGTWTTFETSYKHTASFIKSEYMMGDINIFLISDGYNYLC